MLTVSSGGAQAPASPLRAVQPGDVPPGAPESLDKIPIALLVEFGSGQTLLAREADRRFIPASITKVMTAYVAFELIEGGDLALDTRFTMSEAAAEEWHRTGSTMFLDEGDTASVADLLRGIAGVSANDGAIVLAEGAAGSVANWLVMMNAQARALGMRDSHFGTPNGWPDGGRTFTTARDLEKLARAMIRRHPRKFARFFGQPGFAYNGIAQANRDPISGVIEGADGIKTGFTRQAGNGFLGTAMRDGRRLLMVVAAVDRASERNRAARDLMEWGFDNFEQRRIYARGEAIGSARVQDGDSPRVGLVAAEPVDAAMPGGQAGPVKLAIRYEGPLRAPIAAGERVAQLEVTIGDLAPYRVPLAAQNDVPKASPWQRLINGLAEMFG